MPFKNLKGSQIGVKKSPQILKICFKTTIVFKVGRERDRQKEIEEQRREKFPILNNSIFYFRKVSNVYFIAHNFARK